MSRRIYVENQQCGLADTSPVDVEHMSLDDIFAKINDTFGVRRNLQRHFKRGDKDESTIGNDRGASPQDNGRRS